jgi:hypothetical protein
METSAIIEDAPTSVNINVGKHQNLTLQYSVTNTRKSTPFYVRAAIPRMNPPLSYTKGYEIMDALRIINELNYSASFTFFALRDKLNTNTLGRVGKVAFAPTTLTKTEQTTFSKGYQYLKNKGLLYRVEKGVYMFNPNFLIPADYQEALEEWVNIFPPAPSTS